MGAHSDFAGLIFRIMGILLGAPSLALFVASGLPLLRSLLTGGSGGQSGESGNALVDVLLAFPRVLGWMAEGISKLGTLLLGLATFVGFLGTGVGTALFFTGRGIAAQQGWARGVGMLLAAIVLLFGIVLALSLRKHAAGWGGWAMAGAGGYLLWALLRRA